MLNFESGVIVDKKYKSSFSGRDVTAAQYLAETMCNRQAIKKKERLVDKFWNTPKWRMPFKQQILAAHALLKIYEPEEIIAAIMRKDALWIFSLRFPGLNQIILEEKDRLDKLKNRLSNVEIPTYDDSRSDVLPAEPFKPESKINKLRNLDG